jgi:hypothetical protein
MSLDAANTSVRATCLRAIDDDLAAKPESVRLPTIRAASYLPTRCFKSALFSWQMYSKGSMPG